MANQITIKLNGNIINTLPVDITQFEEEVVRDKELFGIITKYPLDLTFTGDGYKYLLGLKKNSGFCTRVEVEIFYAPNNDPTYGTLIRGYLIIADTEHNHTKKTIRCSIEDNNFGAILKQNSKIPVDVRSVLSRNGETITATPTFNLTVYTPATGVDYVDTCDAYDVEDVFEHLISFLSDGEISFQSDFLTNLPDDEKLCFVRGAELRLKSSTLSQCINSFEEIMTFLHKKYNLWFCIDNSGVTPIFRLEEESFFYGTQNVSIDQVKEVVETFDQEKLTASVKVGNADAIKEIGVAHSLPFVDAISFVEEKYYLKGNCGIDAELDLLTDKIQSDSNIIEDQVNGVNGDYDDYTFCVQYVGSTTTAHKGTYIISSPTTVPVLYNEQMLNLNVLNRFTLPADVSLTLGDGTNEGFRASRTNNTALADTSPIDFDDETTPPNEDPGTNYDTATFRYTAPGNGLYSFEIGLNYEITALDFTAGHENLYNFFSPSVDIEVSAIRRNSLGTSIQTIEVNQLVHTSTGVFQSTGNFTLYLNAGDTVEGALNITLGAFVAMTANLLGGTESYFKTKYVFTGGGDIQSGDPNNINSIILDFKRGISNKDWRALVSQSYNGIAINTNGSNNTLCWIESVKRKIFTGTCDFKLVTNLAQMKLWEI